MTSSAGMGGILKTWKGGFGKSFLFGVMVRHYRHREILRSCFLFFLCVCFRTSFENNVYNELKVSFCMKTVSYMVAL